MKFTSSILLSLVLLIGVLCLVSAGEYLLLIVEISLLYCNTGVISHSVTRATQFAALNIQIFFITINLPVCLIIILDWYPRNEFHLCKQQLC